MSAIHDQGTFQGSRLFPRRDDETLTPLHPVFPTNSFQLILEVLRENVENAWARGDVTAVLGYTSAVTGLTGAIRAIHDAYETIDVYATVLDHTEKGIAQRFEESVSALNKQAP